MRYRCLKAFPFVVCLFSIVSLWPISLRAERISLPFSDLVEAYNSKLTCVEVNGSREIARVEAEQESTFEVTRISNRRLRKRLRTLRRNGNRRRAKRLELFLARCQGEESLQAEDSSDSPLSDKPGPEGNTSKGDQGGPSLAPDPCPGMEGARVFPVNGLCPSPSTEVVFISSEGPFGDGSSHQLPLVPPTETLILEGDRWYILERGKTYSFEIALRGGLSAIRPAVVTSYGSSVERPLVLAQNGGDGIRDDLGTSPLLHTVISGLHLKPVVDRRGTGIDIVVPSGENLVVEDTVIERFNEGVAVDTCCGSQTGRFNGFTLQDSIIVDNGPSSPMPDNRGQGLRLERVDNTVIRRNLFDFNGHPSNDPENATHFNHNMYLHEESGPVIVEDNIVANGSNNGIMARNGCRSVARNVVYRNASSIVCGSGEGVISKITDNVVLEGRRLSTNPGAAGNNTTAWGIRLVGTWDALVSGNIVAHSNDQQLNDRNGSYAFGSGLDGQLASQFYGTFRNNIAYEWGEFPLNISGSSSRYDRLTFERNDFRQNSGIFSFFQGGFNSERFRFEQNVYSHPLIPGEFCSLENADDLTSDSPGLYSGGDYSFLEWLGIVEPTAIGTNLDFSEIRYPDPDRNLTRYAQSIHLDDRNHDGIINDRDLFLAAREVSRLNPRPELSARAIANYVREGFDMTPVP
ncbi:MAG: right-handed parallel beta-helix repeat-containing protein [Bdellovibrionales bacterium]|nr:right-handed parallel beta-helix repeat-containing protein [Bdellovibrionales bacterium]